MVNTTMVYSYPENVTTLLDLFKWADTSTSGAFAIGILLVVFVISYMSMKKYVGSKAFLGAGTITLILSIVMMGTGLVSNLVPIALAVLVVAVLWVVRRQGRS